MSSESISPNTRTCAFRSGLKCCAAVTAVALFIGMLSGGGCSDDKPELERKPPSVAMMDSALKPLVPDYKWTSKRAHEWLADQKEAIRRDSLALDLVVNVIKWHRAEVSDVAGVDGYVTFPVVEKWDFDLGLDSVLPLTVTELNKQPLVEQMVFFFPDRGRGIDVSGNLQEKFGALITEAGVEFATPEHFRHLMIKFLELVSRDPILLLDKPIDWYLYELVDGLVHDTVYGPATEEWAQQIHSYVMSRECTERIDTLPQAIALRAYLDEHHPGWDYKGFGFSVMESNPSYNSGVYRTQLDYLNAVTVQVFRVVFEYSRDKGLTSRLAELHPPRRERPEL